MCIRDRANLAEAWKRVRENKGSAGIDGLTVAGFEQRQDELLDTLHKQLREKTYRPSPVKRVAIPKLGGGTRNLGIPSVRGLYAVPREKSVARFKDQIRNLTQRRAPVRLRDMIEGINPIIRGWGNYYRKANVRKLFHRLDGWIERRLWSFISKRWRNTAWRRYPTSCLIADFGLLRLIHLVPGIRPNLRQPARPT